jgi:integrase
MACIKKRRGKWVVDWRDSSGRRRWESKANKKAAQDRLAEILQGDEANRPVETRTFQEYAEWWLKNVAKGSIKESTYQEYESVLKKHVYPTLSAVQFVDVKRPQIRQLIADKKAEGYEPATIRNIMAPVRSMYNQAIEDGITDKNPGDRIGKLNKRDKDKPKKKIDALTRQQVQTFLQTAYEKRAHWYPLFLCACRTGLREGELIALKGTDVDFNGCFLHVQRNLSRGKISVTKNGRDRKVDMSDQLVSVLSELLSARRSKALQEEFKKPAEERRDKDAVVNEAMDNWLFQTPVVPRSELAKKRRPDREPRGGTQLDPSNLRKVFNRLLTAAKLRRVRFHDLRHTFASLLIQQGESLPYVRDQLGHSSIQITVDTYGHLVPGGNRAAVNKLDIEVLEKTETEPEAAAAE